MFEQIHNIVDVYKKTLDGLSQRHKVYSNNIANVDTPNFKRSDVKFEEELWKSISSKKEENFPGIEINYTHPLHYSLEDYTPYVGPVTFVDKNTTYRNDGNNIDIDVEMAKLAKNEITYATIAQILGGKFSKLKHIATEG